MFGRKKKLPEITTSRDGFSVDEISVTWSQIVSITAYKLDLLTYDMLCFDVEIEGRPPHIRLTEEWPGFKELSDELESRFSFAEGWWDSVVKPAFKTNETRLYHRA